MAFSVSHASRLVLLCSILLSSFIFLSGCTSQPSCTTASDCPPGAARCVNGACTSSDEHGCVPDGGYEWCAALQECIQPWMTACVAQNGSNPQPQAGNFTLSSAHNAFGFNLFGKVLADGPDKNANVMISPASISLALSMAYAGSAGVTQQEMGSVLQVGNASQEYVNLESQSLIQRLSNRSDVNLSIADSLWLNSAHGFQFRQEYQGSMESYYGASAQSLDFSDEPNSANVINGWVSNNTNGKITGIIEADELPKYESALINAVYFKGKWSTPFNKNLTESKPFAASDGSSQQAPEMSQSGEYWYFEDDSLLGSPTLQAIALPYGDPSDPSQQISMYVFLPSNMKSFTQGLDENAWNGMKAKFSYQEGSIHLPKFKYGYGTDLVPQLKEIGMKSAFSSTANFSKMSATPLAIGTVKHKAYIETNEEGSEAAAVTFIGMQTSAAVYNPNEPKPFDMNVDKPFFYAIVDDSTGEILFMGVVNNPLLQ